MRTGKASVLIKANVNAPTQFAQLRVTDLTSGQQLVGNFLIQQVTDGSQGPRGRAQHGHDHRPLQGRVLVRLPGRLFHLRRHAPLSRVVDVPERGHDRESQVNASGGFFEAITNGTCVNPLTFTIVDATGRQTTATLVNLEGTRRGAVARGARRHARRPYTTTCLYGQDLPLRHYRRNAAVQRVSGTGTIIPQVVNATGRASP